MGIAWAVAAVGQSAAARALEFPPRTGPAPATTASSAPAASSATAASSAPATAPGPAAAPLRPGVAAEQTLESHGELMRLPPLASLIELARKNAVESRSLDIAVEQEHLRAKMARLRSLDVVTVQGAGVVGRRDVFAINSDGTVNTAAAALIDNTQLQGAISLRVNPMQVLINRKAATVSELEADRLRVQKEAVGRGIAEGVTQLYDLAQKSLDLMDVRAQAAELNATTAELAARLFEQGAMTLGDYAQVANDSFEAAAKFEDARGDFRLYYQMLMTRVYGELP